MVLVTPVIESLHEGFPDAAIDLLVKKGNEQLFTGHPFLGHVIIWDKSTRKYGHLVQLIRQIRASRYDHIMTMQRFASTGLLTAFSGARHTTGFEKNPLSFLFTQRIRHHIARNTPAVHEVDRNLLLIEYLGIKTKRRPVLYPSEKDRDAVSAYQVSDYICIAPASLWFTKQFPPTKWVEFITRLPVRQTIYLIGSKEDHPVCETVSKQAERHLVVNLAGKFNLLQTAVLMKGARMNYVNDSAPQHLASAVNAPVTAVFCSTVPAFGFGPLSDDSAVVQTTRKLDCRPCGLHGYRACPEKHFDCAMTIEPEQLLERIKP